MSQKTDPANGILLRHQTQEAYRNYLRERDEILAEGKAFATEGATVARRNDRRAFASAISGYSVLTATILAGAIDLSMASFQLPDFVFLGAISYGIGAPVIGHSLWGHDGADRDEQIQKLEERSKQAVSDLLDQVEKEVASYGMAVTGRDSVRGYVLTNRGPVLIAADQDRPEEVQLILDGKVLQPSYGARTRLLTTLGGSVINAPEIELV